MQACEEVLEQAGAAFVRIHGDPDARFRQAVEAIGNLGGPVTA